MGCQTMPSGSRVEKNQKEIIATDLSFDVNTGEIKYTLPEPALVRIRIGIRDGGPMLRTLVDWEYKEAGPQVEVWDKKDETGKVNFGTRSDYFLVLACIPSEANRTDFHSDQIRGLRKSPQLQVTFPQSMQKSEEGIPTLSGIVPVRIEIDKKDHWITQTKYEVGLYVDHVFIIEDEEGTNPITYQLDTHKLNNGMHILTTVITCFDGEAGTKNLLVLINN